LLLSAICERLLTEWKDTHVLLGSRSQERGQQAVDDLISTIGGDCQERLQLLVLDTSSDDSVRQAANKLQESGNTNLYGIINNAGVRKFGARESNTCVCDVYGLLGCQYAAVFLLLHRLGPDAP
jgi:NAD(P)-dependent dehydrogenase (short-subunit alcohol dehydrogenase family)